MAGGYSQQGYRPPQTNNWAPPGPPSMQQPAYGYMHPGAYPGQPPQYTQSPYGSYPSQPAAASGGYSSAGYDQSSNGSTQQTTPGAGYDYYNQQQTQQQPLGTSSAPADATNYNYGGYNAQQAQTGISQPTQNAQTGYDQGYGYGGTAVNPGQDGSAPSQQGYASQPPSYPSSQAGYSQTAQITQPGYGQSPQAQKPPAVQTQAAAYVQPGAAQSGYGQPPPSQPVYAHQTYGQHAPGYNGGGYPQPPVYSSEGGTVPAVPVGLAKASPES